MGNTTEIKVLKSFGNLKIGENTNIEVRLLDINKFKYVDIRRFFIPENEKNYQATKKGISIKESDFLSLEKVFAEVMDSLKGGKKKK